MRARRTSGFLPRSGSYYEITGAHGRDRSIERTTISSQTWEEDFIRIGGHEISPYGADNLLPNNVTETLKDDALIPPLLETKRNMLFGDGEYLYKEVIAENGLQREEVLDPEVSDWLESFNFFDYFIRQAHAFWTLENNFAKVVRLKGHHIGKSAAVLEFVDPVEARLGRKKAGSTGHIFTADWADPYSYESDKRLRRYPVFDRSDPFRHPHSMLHYNNPTTGMKYYSLPVYFGLLKSWTPLIRKIPKWHDKSMDNSLNLKYHIKVPHSYFTSLKDNYGWDENDLEAYEEMLFDEIDEFLAGSDNPLKSFKSKYTTDPISGKEVEGWKIELIDNNVKELAESFLKLYDVGEKATGAGVNIPTAISNMNAGRNMNSGSEMLYAYNAAIAIQTPIPRRLILGPVNTLIRANWPHRDVKVGIRDIMLNKQEQGKEGMHTQQP